MEDCIFCKIASGEIPAHKVFETDKILTFLDNHPINYGHVLIIPKSHHENLIDAPEDVLREIITTAKKLAPAILKATGLQNYNLVMNSGKDAGQKVFHTHFHIIPRFSGDGYGRFRVPDYKEGEGEKMAEKIKENL